MSINQKNYYQEKNNGTSGGNGNSKSNNSEALLKRIAQLEKSQKLFELSLEHANDAVVTIKSDNTICFYNSFAKVLFGYSEDEVAGKPADIIIPAGSIASHNGVITGNGIEVKLIKKNGDRFWASLSGSRVDVGDEVYNTLFIKDISIQKINDDSIGQIQRELETRMAQLDTACLVSETDLNGVITFVNDKFCEVSKFSKEELIGKPHHIVRHPEVPSELFRDMWTAIQDGKIFRDVIRNKSKSGHAFWVDAIIAPVAGPDGKPAKYIAIQYDITEQKKKEEELHTAMEQSLAQEEELRQTMEEITATQEEVERKQREMEGQMKAINSISAFVEYRPDGTMLSANDLFLGWVKYKASELEEKHHRILCDPSYARSKKYEDFWANLHAGKPQLGEFKHIAKDGEEVWMLSSYTPVMDTKGNMLKIIQLASNITQAKLESANFSGQIAAINKSQAVVEFNIDGTIINANENFLDLTGYKLSDIISEHHQIFVEKGTVRSKSYKEFWDKLSNGEYVSGEFKLIASNGDEIWIQASYNPIFDLNGKPFKIVEYATDITAQKVSAADVKGQMDAVSRSSAVIEFDLDGTVLHANENFLKVIGYTLEEIKGRHHRMFVDPSYVNSQEYKLFWERLNRGEFVSGDFDRIGKNGQEVYLTASYNPILDVNGKIVKVVKFAYDITEFTHALKAVSKFTAELRNGNLQANLSIRSDGDLGKMIEDNLALRDTLRDIVADVNKVVKAAGVDGDLQARLNITTAKGVWKELVDSINQLLQSIAEPVMEFNKIISDMSAGDLTHRFQMSANGDIRNMAAALNKAIENLNELLYNIGKNSDIVSSSAINMLQKTESMKRNTNEVATAISQMAKGAQDQATRTDESSKFVDKVMTSSNVMEQKANLINKAAEKGQKSSENGLRIIKTLVNNMSGIKESAGQTSKSIEILTGRAEEIGRTLNVITDIASQTNLLALNAAIEAARAGDAGRGFAVVAEEIRKLAEDSRRSAVEIEKIISDVQKDTQAAGKAIDIMQLSVKDGNHATIEAESIFQEIARSSEETFSFSKEIQEATSSQKASIDLVVKNIEQIVVVAEETAAGTQEVASSSQQLNNAMTEITESSNKLSGVASELQSGINRFKLRKASQ
jgi:methyl-accepting chemotaxis protein